MELQLDNGEYQVVFKDANLSVAVEESAPLNVIVGENAKIQVEQAIDYIKSGQAEIEEAVQEGIASFDSNATQKTNTYNQNAQDKLSAYNTNAEEKLEVYNSNATSKTNAYNDNASEKLSAYNLNAQDKLDAYNLNDTSKTNAFNQNATDKTDAFNSNASDKTTAFNNNATSKTGDFNDNATAKTTAFNENATNKTDAFNLNASNKTTDFNDNYTAKKALIDAQVSVAEGAATTATTQAGLAKQWAIGDPSEPTGNSAKYWAEQASSSLGRLSTRVSTIEGKIPSAASSSNQLADKSYVDTADNDLQSQIDAIVASSDVFDIVGTYAELQAYDISTVPVNDIIKVLVDSTHNDAATYYRCVENNNVKSWSYIGSEGAYYTKGEADAKFATITTVNGKQDTLVSGSNIKTINSTSLLGSGDVAVQPTLVSGTNIKTINNTSLLGSGNVTVQETLVSGTNIKTINNNSVLGSGDLTVTAQAVWGSITGTISDQTDLNTALNGKLATDLSNIVTAGQEALVDLLYPVGSVYIGTGASCPLSAIKGTWTLQSSAIVTSVDTSVPIKGNGKTLTLSDGSHTVGFYAASSGSGYLPLLRTALANVNIGTAGSGSGIALKGLGVTTDSSKSGIVGTVTRSTLSVNIWERTA